MYWQVYLHKTALVSEKMLINTFRRARHLISVGQTPETPRHLNYFLQNQPTLNEFRNNPEVLANFALLDDNDIMSALKTWVFHPDKVLSILASGLLNRNLLSIEIQENAFDQNQIDNLIERTKNKFKLDNDEEAAYFVFTGSISNNTYNILDDRINILYRDNTIRDIAEASDMLDLSVLGKTIKKEILCYPKEIRMS